MSVVSMSMPTADQSPLESEAKAVLESGWWISHGNDASQRCKWTGISCNPAGSIIKIDLSDQQIGGNIPPRIGDLSALEYLGLSTCDLSGELPPPLETLPIYGFWTFPITFISLGILGSSFKSITRFYSPRDWELIQVDLLVASFKSITRFYSQTDWEFIQLEPLGSSFKPINWFYSQEIGNLDALTVLYLSRNRLNGSIPSDSQAFYFIILDLSFNQLSGTVPTFILLIFIFMMPEMGVTRFLPILLKEIRVYRLAKKNRAGQQPEKNGDTFSIWNYDGKIAYEDIIAANRGFPFSLLYRSRWLQKRLQSATPLWKSCCLEKASPFRSRKSSFRQEFQERDQQQRISIFVTIGVGGYRSVYRVQLPCGKVCCLEKASPFRSRKSSFRQEFQERDQVSNANTTSKHREASWILSTPTLHVLDLRIHGEREFVLQPRDEVKPVEMD
ncbi:hypothetical protein F3Y22_tig00111504pilonHSYRG00121 [Hibiscus syriacus]|uniref:Leucine-rich repeat-containing N-terminal plant-type domain-containing protein n=1 Tax=Hibiscus syriacus TaxID=106335 RepID=A0A6A2Y7N2_HIBSY|nr:hypothetical protein F3Y22_tig00111504pilonHSYRG00121 [Hibiscus syriacus]